MGETGSDAPGRGTRLGWPSQWGSQQTRSRGWSSTSITFPHQRQLFLPTVHHLLSLPPRPKVDGRMWSVGAEPRPWPTLGGVWSGSGCLASRRATWSRAAATFRRVAVRVRGPGGWRLTAPLVQDLLAGRFRVREQRTWRHGIPVCPDRGPAPLSPPSPEGGREDVT
jgi:hypothetical protein